MVLLCCSKFSRLKPPRSSLMKLEENVCDVGKRNGVVPPVSLGQAQAGVGVDDRDFAQLICEEML